jgi:guanine deaminase
MPITHAFRAALLHFHADPGDTVDSSPAFEHFTDGLLWIEDGRVKAAGDYATLALQLPHGTSVTDYRGKLICPGFIDTHVHYPQTDVIASYGEDLLGWLERYTFPTERAFGDPVLARATADFFLDELLANGTTSASIFATVHPQSADAIFASAQARGMRIAAGKCLMDRNAPEYLRDTAASGYAETTALINRWHGQDRLVYSITPRFAATSSEAQFETIAQLLAEHPTVLLQSHLAEQPAELKWIAELFPNDSSYFDVYANRGAAGHRSIYAHCIYLDDADRTRMAATDTAIAFCPTSNLFLGSGLFSLAAARARNIRVGLATDVGGGTSFSMLRTMSEAYKVLALRGEKLTAFRAFYLATRGGAEALGMAGQIGSFEQGREADFVVLDPKATRILERRTARAESLHDYLFALVMLGDDRAVAATYLQGVRAATRYAKLAP